MRVLSADDIRRAVSVAAAVDAVADAFVQLTTGRANVPLRVPIAQPAHDSHTFFMPALLTGIPEQPSQPALGLKVVSVYPHNAERHDLPTIHALIALFDPATGQPLAVMDGRYLTALRTGAASGAATRALAREDARVLAMFGAGFQALFQVLAVCAVRPIERVLIVNRSRLRAQQLVEQLRQAGAPRFLEIAPSAAAALREADVVCCATSAPTAVFDDGDVQPGTHINGVGSFTPTMVVVPPETVGRARVVVDQHAAAWSEAGDLLAARERGLLDETRTDELGAVIAGLAPGRADAEQVTFFKSVGNAVQDLAVASLALRSAEELELGSSVLL
jgi:ornithine cyclodeaminase